MELTFPHRVNYRDGTSSIDEIIENLKAQKRLLEQGTRVLDAAIPGLVVENVKVKVVTVAAGSLLTELVVLIYTSYQDDVQDTIVGGIEGLLSVDIPPEYEALVTLLSLAVVYFVARYAYDKVRERKGDRPPSVHIEGDYNTVINVVADKLSVPASRIEHALHDAVPVARRRSLIGSVRRFLKPREDGRISPVEVTGFGVLNEAGIAEYPSDSELSEIDESRNLDIPEATLDIRATDKDRSKTGWAAVIVGDSRFNKRLPMDLYPTVDAEALAKMERVTGDIVVEGERNFQGAFKPKRIHLLNVKEPPVQDLVADQPGRSET
jgi:hypothetical protein